MKKRVLSLLMSFVMVISPLPATIQAAETDTISVTVKFDASTVAEDLDRLYGDLKNAYIVDEDTTKLPNAITVEVPTGSTVKDVIAAAKAKTDFSVEGLDGGYITQVGFVGNDILGNLVTTEMGNYNAGNVFSSAGWSFYIDDVALSTSIAYDTVTQDGAVVEGRYRLYGAWDSASSSMVFYDDAFINAYTGLKALTQQTVDTTDFTESQLTAYQIAKSEAQTLLTGICDAAVLNEYNSAILQELYSDFHTSGGMWIGYIENKQTNLWGSGSPTEQLKAAYTKLENAIIAPSLEPCQLLALSVCSLGDFPNASTLTPEFSPNTQSYTVSELAFTKMSYELAYRVKATAVGENSEIKASMNGVEATVTSGSGNWTLLSNCLRAGQDNTLTITVTNGEASKTYTVTVPMAADPAAPKLKGGVNATATASVVQGSAYTLDLDTIFTKGTSSADLTYKVKVDENEETATGKDYSLATDELLLGSHTLVFTAYSGALASPTYTVTLIVTEPAAQKSARVNTLLTNIASANTNTDSDWLVMEMGAYAATHPSGNKLTESAKQNYINLVVSTLESGVNGYGNALGDTDYDKMILALTAIGADAQQVYPVNSNTPLSLIEKLNGVTHSTSPWSAPYTLAAYNQRDYANTEAYERALIEALLANQQQDGSWSDYGTIDTTANVIAGLAFYRSEPRVEAAIEKAVSYLSSAQKATGVYDDGQTGMYAAGENANSTAMVVIGLAAVGVNPDTDSRFIKNDVSLLDGLLSFALSNNSGFWRGNDKTNPNAMATEQAFRALIAAKQVMTTGNAYNIYDFSATPVSPARATGSGAVSTPSDPTGDKITVRVTIKADTGYWLNNKSVTISGEGATVYHAFTEALKGTGITQVGAASGYVSSMTKNGRTLAEFTNGKNSGWLYKVNGTLPTVGLTSQAVNNGDSIVFYYTNDWTLDPDAGSMSEPKKPEASSSLAPSVTVSNGAASAEISSGELDSALKAAEKDGESAVTIAPQLRGTVDTVTVLLPLSAAAAAAEQGVQLVIDTGAAQVVLDAEVLTELTGNGGSELAVEISAKSSADLTGTLTQDKLADAVIAQVTVTAGDEKIISFGGKSLTVELPVDKDTFRTNARVRVYLFSDDGSVERTVGLCVEKDGKLVVRVETKHLSTFVVLPETALPFTDVDDAAWYVDAVRYAYDHELMTGVSSDSFLPDGTATRAQLVTILHRLAGSPAVDYLMQFSDVSEAAWYAEAVRWAASEGIVTGCDDGSFRPDDAITREQLAAILYRYVCAQGGGFTGMWYFPLRYEDAGAVSAWANEAMHWCVMRGILTGTSATTLEPSASATRSQLATILQRFCTLDAEETPSSAEQAYQGAAAYLADTVSAPTVASIGGEWTVLALARGDVGGDAQFDSYLSALERTLRETSGVLSERKYTEYSRVILALSALGEDARSFAGYDLTLPLADYGKTVAQGVNGVIFALLALDSADYPMPRGADASAQATRERYVDCILSAQRADGGWSLKSDAASADPDLTAMALQSLAAYRGQRKVGTAITAALDCLSALQNADGGFSASGAANAESCAQVLLALNALGIDTDDARFVKNGRSALDALLTFQTVDGGFRHIAGGETNLMASEQAACALAALVRAERGESSFYCMNSTAAAKAA